MTASKLGPIWLQPGVTRRNALTYFYAAFFTIGMVAFMSFMQPYVINENLQIPVDIRGAVLGVFNMCGSIGILCVTLLAGYVFDAWKPGGAFIVVGFINLIVCAIAFRVRRKVGYRSPHGELV